MKKNIFCSNLKVEIVIHETGLMMYLNQFKLKLYQTYKDLMEEVQVGLLIQS